MDKRKRVRSVAVGTVVIVLVLVGAVLNGSVFYLLAYADAKDAYRSSRPGEIGSYRFLSRGVRYGMTREEVAGTMTGAYLALSGNRDDQPIDVFLFRYGPPWRKPFSKMDRHVFEEEYIVFYNTTVGAVRMEREMIEGSGPDVTVDLQAQKVVRN